MADVSNHKISDQKLILQGGTRTIHFRPFQAGPINIRSAATKPPRHSESGFLGKVSLLRPGSTTPVASTRTKIGQSLLTITYQATAADLAIAGQWTCQVINSTEADIAFQTDITNVASTPLQSASFDIGLLNALLSEITTVAQFQVAESLDVSTASQIVVSWSDAVSSLFGGLSRFEFGLPDKSVGPLGLLSYRFEGFNSQPGFPTMQLLTGPLRLRVVLDFQPNATLKALSATSQDVHVASFRLTADMDFDGNITVTCDTKATLGGVDGKLDTGDPSDDLKSGVEDAIRTKILESPQTGGDPQPAPLGPQSLKPRIDSFFVLLMRLGTGAAVDNYIVDGNNLIVNYLARDTGGSSASGAIVDVKGFELSSSAVTAQ